MDSPEFVARRDDKTLVPGGSPPPADELGESADQILVAALRTWLSERHMGSNKRAAAAVWRWMDVKGLD